VRTLRAASIGRFRRGIRAEAGVTAQIQQLLNDAGFAAGAVDGEFGPMTEAAAQKLQRSVGLVPSGIIQIHELEMLQSQLG